MGTGNTRKFLQISGAAPAGQNGIIEIKITKDGSQVLFRGITKLIRNPNGINFTFDNTEMKNGFNILDNSGQNISVDFDGDPEFDEDVLGLENTLSIKLPSGEYTIEAFLYDENKSPLFTATPLTFSVKEISSIDLVQPFDGEGNYITTSF